MTAVDIVRRGAGGLHDHERASLAGLLGLVANEFVPPLTSRHHTTQVSLRGLDDRGGDDYLVEMTRQDNLLLRERGRLEAFLSFRNDHVEPRLPEIAECTYVSTVAVRPASRRHGYARQLYEALFKLPDVARDVVLRTWSTNAGHLRLLGSLGFVVLLTLPDDRGDGIDTLYLGRLS